MIRLRTVIASPGRSLPGLRRDDGRVGFTLIELLAALAIFLVVVSASYALFDGGRQLAARGEYHARRFQAARAAFQAMSADLRFAFTGGSYDGGFVARKEGTEELPLCTLEAAGYNHQAKLATPASTTLSETAAKEFDIARVTWSIDQDENTKAAGLVRRTITLVPRLVTVDDPEDGLEEISPDIVGLRFRFYDGTEWLETWDSTTSRTLPRVIEATVYVKSVFREKEEIEAFKTSFFLPLGGAR